MKLSNDIWKYEIKPQYLYDHEDKIFGKLCDLFHKINYLQRLHGYIKHKYINDKCEYNSEYRIVLNHFFDNKVIITTSYSIHKHFDIDLCKLFNGIKIYNNKNTLLNKLKNINDRINNSENFISEYTFIDSSFLKDFKEVCGFDYEKYFNVYHDLYYLNIREKNIYFGDEDHYNLNKILINNMKNVFKKLKSIYDINKNILMFKRMKKYLGGIPVNGYNIDQKLNISYRF